MLTSKAVVTTVAVEHCRYLKRFSRRAKIVDAASNDDDEDVLGHYRYASSGGAIND